MSFFRAVFNLLIQSKVNSYIAYRGKAGSLLKKSLPMQRCLLEVAREQYTDFYRDKERWRYLQKLDTKNSLLSLDGFMDDEGNALDFIADESADVEKTVIHAVMLDRLKTALPLLLDSEQALIQAIFFDGLTEREVGFRLHFPPYFISGRQERLQIFWNGLNTAVIQSISVLRHALSKTRPKYTDREKNGKSLKIPTKPSLITILGSLCMSLEAINADQTAQARSAFFLDYSIVPTAEKSCITA